MVMVKNLQKAGNLVLSASCNVSPGQEQEISKEDLDAIRGPVLDGLIEMGSLEVGEGSELSNDTPPPAPNGGKKGKKVE